MIAFRRVKESPLIIGIVDRIKINSEQLFPFSAVRAVPYFLQTAAGIIYVCFVYFPGIAEVWIIFIGNVSFIQLCCERGARSDVAKEISGRGRRRGRDEKGNQGVGYFHFINIVQLVSIYFFSIILLYHFFSIPTTFTHTHTHDPRPLPITHDPRHLATLFFSIR